MDVPSTSGEHGGGRGRGRGGGRARGRGRGGRGGILMERVGKSWRRGLDNIAAGINRPELPRPALSEYNLRLLKKPQYLCLH